MRKPILTIFYQFNPWSNTIGGIETIIRTFIKYALSEFELQLVGTGDESHKPVSVWQEAELEGKSIRFMPLFTQKNNNCKSLVPNTLKYTFALLGHSFASDFMHFHRLEPTLATLRWPGEKTLFIHIDIQKQMYTGGDKNEVLWRHFPAGYFALERLLLGQFNQILSCNTESLKLYQKRYPALTERIAYIKNSVDNQIYYSLTFEEREKKKRLLAQQMGLAEDTRFVLFAGRLQPQKDPMLLIRAFAALNDPKVHLLIAGEGDLRDEISSEISRLGLGKQATMLGPLPPEKLAELQRVCNVFVLTSAYEGLPLVVLEALACGTPVVTTRCGETPNLLSANSGVVCQGSTPVAVADALRKVLQNPDNYPIEACVKTAEPYSAQTVVGGIYSDMLHRWQQRNVSIYQSSSITHLRSPMTLKR